MSAPTPAPDAQHPAYQIARDVLQLLTTLAVLYAGYLGAANHEKITSVEQKQTEVAVKQDEARTAADDVRTKLDAKAEEDARALGVQLYSTAKYLDDVAALSGSAKDAAKAAEAKAAYDEYVRRHAKRFGKAE